MASGYTYELRLKDLMSQGFVKASQQSSKFYNKLIDKQKKFIASSKRVPANIAKIGRHLSSLKTKLGSAFSTLRMKRFNREARKSKGILSGIGGVALGFLGISSAISFARNSLQKFDVQAKADAQLKSVLISTNNAAGRSYDQLKKQASALQGKTLFGDEETEGIQAMLLTFKNVRTEIFDQSIPAIQDMATAMKVDGKSAALQLGKALNDPATGLTMLGRSGITFTESQKVQIKMFQKTNQLAKAQSIILGEINSQFKGSAEAAAKSGEGAWQQFMNRVGDKMETFGGWLSAIKGHIAIFFNSFLDQAQPLIDAWSNLKEAISPLFTAIGSFVGAMSDSNDETDAAGKTIGALSTVINILAAIIEFVVTGIVTLLKFLEPIAPILKWITIAVVALKIAFFILNAVMYANPVGLIIAAIIILIALIATVINKWDEWGAAVTLFMGPLGLVINMVMTFAKHWDKISKSFSEGGFFAGIKAIGAMIVDFMLTPIQQLLELVANVPGLGDLAEGGAESIKALKRSMGIEEDDGAPKNVFDRFDSIIQQMNLVPSSVAEKMATFTKRIDKLPLTDELKKKAITEARKRFNAFSDKKSELEAEKIAQEGGVGSTAAGIQKASETSQGIATGGKKQFVLNVQIDKVLETVNQTVTNGEQSANDLVDEILDNLTRRLHGTFRSLGQ